MEAVGGLSEKERGGGVGALAPLMLVVDVGFSRQ